MTNKTKNNRFELTVEEFGIDKTLFFFLLILKACRQLNKTEFG